MIGNLASMADARKNLADLVNQVAYGKERITLTRKDKPLVALVPIEDIALLEKMEEILDLKEIEEIKESIKKEGTISWESLKSGNEL